MRLIASDLDGTLFGPNKVPEARTVAAVNAIVEAGYVFAAVTGRSYFGGAARVVSTGATAHWFIGSNGGHRYNMATEQLEERLLFGAEELAAVTSHLPTQIPGIGFGLEHAGGFTYDEAFCQAFPESFDGGRRSNTTSWAPDDVGKVFASHPEMDLDDLIAAVKDHVPDGTHVSTSGTAFVEFTPPGGDKALGLERLCNKLDIDRSEVVAFGDNNNDVSMLGWAGRGIAMANATADALAAADEVTASNLDFGVATVLEQLLASH